MKKAYGFRGSTLNNVSIKKRPRKPLRIWWCCCCCCCYNKWKLLHRNNTNHQQHYYYYYYFNYIYNNKTRIDFCSFGATHKKNMYKNYHHFCGQQKSSVIELSIFFFSVTANGYLIYFLYIEGLNRWICSYLFYFLFCCSTTLLWRWSLRYSGTSYLYVFVYLFVSTCTNRSRKKNTHWELFVCLLLYSWLWQKSCFFMF